MWVWKIHQLEAEILLHKCLLNLGWTKWKMFFSWLSKSRLYLCAYFRMRSQTLYRHRLVYCTTVLSNENKESSRYGVTNQHEHLIPCHINNTTATRDNKRGLIKTGYLQWCIQRLEKYIHTCRKGSGRKHQVGIKCLKNCCTSEIIYFQQKPYWNKTANKTKTSFKYREYYIICFFFILDCIPRYLNNKSAKNSIFFNRTFRWKILCLV